MRQTECIAHILRRRLLLVLALLPLVLAAACGGGSGDDDDDDGGNGGAAAGGDDPMIQLFASRGCAECHGAEGEGTDTPRTELAGTRMIIQQFSTRVRNGRGSAMPPATAEQISDDEITALWEWLRAK